MALTRKEISAKWRKNNPERNKELYTKYYKEQQPKRRKYQKDWREKNKDYRGGNRIAYMNTVEGWVKYKWSSLKRSAKVRNYEFTIRQEDIQSLIVTRCPVLGIELDYGLINTKKHLRDNSPSVDRIDNSKGYIPGNIVIVSNLVNKIKNSLELNKLVGVLNKIATFYEQYQK